MSQNVVRNLRPHLFTANRRLAGRRTLTTAAQWRSGQAHGYERDVTHDYEKRVLQLAQATGLADCYPRLPARYQAKHGDGLRRLSLAQNLQPGETADQTEDDLVQIGAGSKLMFLDVKLHSGENVAGKIDQIQAVCQLGQLEAAGVTEQQFKQLGKLIRNGDWISLTGWPHRTARGQYSLLLSQLPRLLSPSLHHIPESLEDAETRARRRHVDMIVNTDAIRALRIRHEIEASFHKFFDLRGFTKVITPLLSASAGGAVAKPFKTRATEFLDQDLYLRIAPELWLKRLVVGGLERVYEIGPAFRNEGVDATHNPEFSICEFYQAFASLDDLMSQTEMLLHTLKDGVKSGKPPADLAFDAPYRRIDFIDGIQQGMGLPLPNLSHPDAAEDLVLIFKEKEIPIPSQPTLPRLLDALAAHYLEPVCQNPTFILHHPACMSPLSKHFTCSTTGQEVAARAELFIHGREFANMYEEENSPFEQRRKLWEQLELREIDGEGDGQSEVDESYLAALEWALPPTGGWGCGMDRLVMLFGGHERIADVLSFGSLRNVVGLSRGRC